MDTLVTTIDNPWNPFTHWDEWYEYDESSGYHTCGLVARLSIVSDDLSEYDHDQAVDDAQLRLIKLNPLGVHKIIAKTDDFSLEEVEKATQKLKKAEKDIKNEKK